LYYFVIPQANFNRTVGHRAKTTGETIDRYKYLWANIPWSFCWI